MPVPSNITDLDPAAVNNSPPGTESAKGNIDNYLRAGFAFIRQLYNKTVAPAQITIASAASVAIGSALSENIIISGTTTITSFDTASDGIVRNVAFSGALTLTHNATTLILPGAANIATAAGDCATFISLGSGNWRCIKYQTAGGIVLFGSGGAVNERHGADIASAATINLDTATGNLVDVTGTTTITAITLTDGAQRTVRFTGALTLTHGASLVLPGSANITTAAGDFAVFRGYAAGVVRCVSYTHVATAADQEAASSSAAMVTPSQQHRHPSAAKAWAVVTQSAGTYTLQAAYNIASVNKTGAGTVEINLSTAFSSANYVAVATSDGSSALCVVQRTSASKATVVLLRSSTEASVDAGFTITMFGDQ